jgi:hypothetical protein
MFGWDFSCDCWIAFGELGGILTCRNFINQLLVAGSSFGLCIGILAAKPLWTVAGSYLTVN